VRIHIHITWYTVMGCRTHECNDQGLHPFLAGASWDRVTTSLVLVVGADIEVQGMLLQCVAMCCRVVVCCSVLQGVAVYSMGLSHGQFSCGADVKVHWMLLQYVAVCCSMLQYVAVCCSVLQCVAMCFMGSDVKVEILSLGDGSQRNVLAVCCGGSRCMLRSR